MKNILTIIGTRPEAIKLIPLITELNNNSFFKNKTCLTRQHSTLLDSCNIQADYQFKPCKKNSSLSESAAHMLLQFNSLLEQEKPDLIIVQGDTTTAFIAALAGFYAKIKVAHIEAGLRSGNLYSPWPEEAHRVIIDKISNYFFAPTEKAKNCLINEGVNKERIWAVGNTAIDAIRIIKEKNSSSTKLENKMIVVTIHRRENYGLPLVNICNAIKYIAGEFSDVSIKFCTHPNPSVYDRVRELLSGVANIELLPALDHIEFIELLDQSLFIITDSGGIQEEATFLGKPIIVTRETTERTEIMDAGTGMLVGSGMENIVKHCSMLLKNPNLLLKMSIPHFPYGDGYAARRIVKILKQIL